MSHPSDSLRTRFRHDGMECSIPTRVGRLPSGRTLATVAAVVPALVGGLAIAGMQIGLDLAGDPAVFMGAAVAGAWLFSGLLAGLTEEVRLVLDAEHLTIERKTPSGVWGRRRVPLAGIETAHAVADGTGQRLRIVHRDGDIWVPTSLVPEESTKWLAEQIATVASQRRDREEGEPEPALLDLLPEESRDLARRRAAARQAT